MSMAVASPLSLGSSHYNPCNPECSTSYGIMNSLVKTTEGQRTLEFPSTRNLLFGSTQAHSLHVGRNLCSSRISVAADYSDYLSDSSNHTSNHGYHPLEEVKAGRRTRDTKLTYPEIARTTIEARRSALLVFPRSVHCEPHEQLSWADYQYAIDDYGELIFEILDSENILEDPGANNPVIVFVGMDMLMYENLRMVREPDIRGIGPADIPFEDELIEAVESDESIAPEDLAMPEQSKAVHPVYFAKCLSKAVSKEYSKDMDSPSNGVSIVGFLVPVFGDEEPYLRRLFRNDDDGDVYNLEWRDADFTSSYKRSGSSFNSTLYRLEILCIELFSIYGVKRDINRDDFLDAEPDFLVHSTSAILDRFARKGIKCNVALKALCKKKGLHVEGANLIGVDSLGMDVRTCSGTEVQTHRFPFKTRATSEAAAEKQIQQLLFPRSRRKKLSTHGDGYNSSIS